MKIIFFPFKRTKGKLISTETNSITIKYSKLPAATNKICIVEENQKTKFFFEKIKKIAHPLLKILQPLYI